jgi:hypothetical protein
MCNFGTLRRPLPNSVGQGGQAVITELALVGRLQVASAVSGRL